MMGLESRSKRLSAKRHNKARKCELGWNSEKLIAPMQLDA